MATIFVFIVDINGVPLTSLSPTFDYWDKSSPGAPVATGRPMTYLRGGIGGAYFADISTSSGKEYTAIIDAGATAQSRYSVVTFSGEVDARISTDIPAILSRLPTALVSGRMDSDVGSMQVGVVDGIVDAGWEETAADHVTSGTAGRAQVEILYVNGAVWIDTANGSPGSVFGVNGTHANPVDNLADALTVADVLGSRHLVIVSGNLTLTGSLTETLVDLRDESELNLNGQNVNGSEFVGGVIKGSMSGVVHIHDGDVEDLSGFSGLLHGCGLSGTFTPVAGSTALSHCYSKVAGTTVEIDFNGVASEFSNRGYSGGLNIINMSNVASVASLEFGAGQLIIESSCTAGTLIYRGDVYPVVDNSAGTTVINNSTAAAVAEEPVKDHVALGTMGRAALLDLYRDGDGKGIAIFYDIAASNTNTVLGEDGTQDNPVSSAAAVMTLGTALGIKRAVLDVGLLTLDQDFEWWQFEGDWERGSQIDAAGYSVLGVLFRKLNVLTAVQNGFAAFLDCFIYGNMTGLGGAYTNCIMKGGGTGTFEVAAEGFATFYNMRRYNKEDSEITLVSNGASQILVNGVDGALTVKDTDAADARVEISSAHGALVVLDSSNTDGTIVLAGLIEVDDQSGAGCTVDVSRVTVDALKKTAAAILGLTA